MSIWSNYWLPGNDRKQIQSARVAGLERVSDLICLEGHCWNKRLVEENFAPDDVRMILSIPLPRTFHLDKLVWVKENSGVYTVRSGYYTLLPAGSIVQFQIHLELKF